ncbi:conserved hypothetical protein [Rubrivivax sp. A210]|uniref:glycosyltransferase family 9 protein n=1 Tax=Rubrivivax sp. A210 TaxID=2772301 RepID=UPI001917BED6|nr:glycosyltransferase family 9 protein [Rubrivivax sp. A210]CAD5373652.1 conserved hypothetical protein [Rubrivivax sp. A210]
MNKQPASARPLIVRIRNWVGDVVLGLPALRLLETHGYAPQIVARGKWAPALLAGYPWPVHVQPAKAAAKIAQLRELRRHCRSLDPGFERRENALLLPVSLSSALETRLAGLRTVGVAKEGRSPLLARALPWAREGHELERYWDVACRFLRLQQAPPADIAMQVAPDRAAAAAGLLAAHGIAGGFVMICPFAAGRAATADKAEKKWPAFADFVRLAAAQMELPLVVYPGPGEHAAARELYPTARMIEGSDLAVYLALLQRAALVVANDTGPAHMAAALGRKVISVLGPTEAARWAPWGSGVTVLQRPQSPGTPVAWPSADEGLALAQSLLGRNG